MLTPSPAAVPVITHFGAALGDLTEAALAALGRLTAPGVSHSALDAPRHLELVPMTNTGYTGTPALEGLRTPPGGPVGPRLTAWELAVRTDPDEDRMRATATDQEAGWRVEVTALLGAGGLLRMRTSVTNTGDRALHLSGVRTVVPVAPHATELLDLTGRWCRERSPQRHPWVQGTHLRTGRHGRTGHDATLLLMAGTPGFGFSHGEVWSVHTAWSGDHLSYAERTPEGDCVLGGGELLAPGEISLEPGERYDSPWLLAAYSGEGMDGLAARHHAWLRSRQPRSRTPRPVVVNTWEAVYFDHDLERLGTLADTAAEVGAERFVLDDGWFLGRRHDRAGLGDWSVDPAVWPDGLGPLIDRVHAAGLDFGLWVEPEMVNVDSETAREHPEWILRGRGELPPDWRHQQVLDLQHPEAYARLHDQLRRVLAENDIAYLKWDHNRDLIDATHEGRPAVHGQTLACYRLLDELRAAFPALEIESCASGGGRIDAEVLCRTDRVWPSDTNDAVERQHLQRWTGLLVPPELIGSHVGGPIAHTTGRAHRLGFRAAAAVLYHFGIEWDLTTLSEPERSAIAGWVELHKRIRPLIGTGRLVHPDHPDPAVLVTGLIAEDRSEAWYVVATVAATNTQHPAPIRLTGLDPAASYLVAGETPTRDQHGMDLGESWLTGPGLTVSGSALHHRGVRLPVLPPETAQVIRVVRQTS